MRPTTASSSAILLSSEITGIIYEPWHYRYVGEKFAHEITNMGLTLEEYVAWRRGR